MKIGLELSKTNVDLLIDKVVIGDKKDKYCSRDICIYYKNIGII